MKFTNESFGEIMNVSAALVSPDGKNVAYTVVGQDLKNDKALSFIWIHNVKDGANHQLTFGGDEGNPVWLDDKTLVFPRKEEHEKRRLSKEAFTAFHAVNVDTAETKDLFTVPVLGAQAHPIDGDRWMIYGMADSIEGDGEQGLYEVYDEYPYHADGRGYVNKRRARIYIYTSTTGQLIPVTDHLFQANQIMNSRVLPVLSPDRKRIYYWGETVTRTTSLACDAYAYDIENGKTTLLFKNDTYMLSQCVEFSGRVYFVGCDLKDSFFGIDLVSVSPTGENFHVDLQPDEYLDRVVLVGDRLWLVYKEHDKTKIYEWSPGTHQRFLCCPEYMVEGSLEVGEDGVYFPGSRPLETRQLVRLSEGTAGAVTEVCSGIADRYGLTFSQPVSFKNSAGFTVHGWVLHPHNYKPGSKYPGLLTIHGGPQGAYYPLLYPSMQRYAAEGYFVFFCNPRGSSNYGREHMDISGAFGTIDFDDVMAFTEHVLRQFPDIDGDKLGVTGGSYGGYMTNWIIGHTERFKAAISQRSISNWISFYGCSDLSLWVEWQQKGTPWQNMEGVWWHSPLKYACNIKTPTLFLQNQKDFRCPVEQAEQMVTALIQRGIPTRMVLFHNASHSVMSPKQQRIVDDEVIKWLDRYVKQT